MFKKIWYLPGPVLDLIGLEGVGDKLTVNFSDKGGSDMLILSSLYTNTAAQHVTELVFQIPPSCLSIKIATTTHLSEWLKSEILTPPNASKG